MSATRPIFSIGATVAADWIDYNGHMSVPYYAHLFDRCAERFYEHLGLGRTSAQGGRGSLFSLEHHTTFLHELMEGAAVTISLQLLDWDEKRLHYFMSMSNTATGIVCATSEQLAIHVNTAERASTPLPADVIAKLTEIWPEDTIDAPKEAGHIIRIRRKRPVQE
jgi:acyl-CoA thioester hydrolase